MDLIFREDDFQTDYTNLAMLCETFPNVPVVALTATGSKKDIKVIKQSLNLNNPLEVIGNPNHPNIFYRKVFRKGDDMEFFEKLLEPRACDLKEKKVNYPTTVMDFPYAGVDLYSNTLKSNLLMSFAILTSAEAKPENRLFAQYHAPQTAAIKEQILKELSTSASKVQVIIATVAMGVGLDIQAVRHVIHVGPPCTAREYFQETGYTRCDGKQSYTTLHYHNRDIAKNREGLCDDVSKYCCPEDNCLRTFLLKCLDAIDSKCIGHIYCSYCESVCDCDECLLKSSQVNCLHWTSIFIQL